MTGLDHDSIRAAVRTAHDVPPMTDAEQVSVRRAIALRTPDAAEAQRPARGRWHGRWHLRARFRPVAAGAVVVAVALGAAAAALPGRTSHDREDGAPLPSVATASAAEVLQTTAAAATSLAPGPGEVLHVRFVMRNPYGDVNAAPQYQTTRNSFNIDPRAGTITRDGEEPVRFGPGAPESVGIDVMWPLVLGAEDLRTFPTTPEQQLTRLRAAARLMPDVQSPAERELVAVALLYQLLVSGPLDEQQRAAGFELLATTDAWDTAGSSLRVTNEGRDTVAGEKSGIRIRAALDLGSEGVFRLDFLLDPAAGEVLEVREYEAGVDAAVVYTTTAEVVDAAAADE